LIEALMEVRSACRTEKRFDLADQIRNRLGEISVTIEDTPNGASWSIEGTNSDLQEQLMDLHIETRRACKESKHFALSDLIRDRLAAIGITLEDKANNTTWHISDSKNTK
ncbi:MAG: hypothetical protein GXP29_04180, partial [Planctomycetes bacterium]|nr:hypothetical protein [Planctomycetota bacterium]